MKKHLIGGAVAVLAVGIAPAIAQVAPPPGVAQGTTPVPMARPAPQPQVRFMSDRTLTRNEVAAHVEKFFARLDTNRDGYLTREEINARHGKMMAMHGDIGKRLAERGIHTGDRGAMFDRLDANRDGSISRQEFTAAHPQTREQRVIVMRDGNGPAAPGRPGAKMRMRHMGMGFGGRMFDMADGNHDGRVTLAEAQAAALAHFDRADTNHDGRITPDEHRNVRVMRIERRQG
jgi:Ca2+-binding EF-hand superfamily protein